MFSQLLLPITFAIASSAASASPGDLGTVQFKTSCSPSVAVDFNHSVALLYSFEYDEARDAFIAVSKKDPRCAMAKWGEAMTYFHGLWGEYNAKSGARAAKEAKRLASSNAATTAREKAYIAAISEVFSDAAVKVSQRKDNKPNAQGYSEPAHAPQVAYKDKMAEIHRLYPDDVEGTIFYALALNIVASRADKNHPELHECTALLNPLFEQFPNHPGIAHYLVHCNDNPEMAKEGLVAARKYAQIAPASAHATHMPSHIFAQLGLWDEMVASNRTSMRASEEDVQASACQKTGNTLHSMHYLIFALLQQGQLAEARKVLANAKRVPSEVPGGDKCDEDDALLVAGYAMETGEWERTREIHLESTAYSLIPGIIWMAKGVGAARTGDLTAARQAEAQLATMRDAQAKHSHHGSTDTGSEAFRLAVTAWIAHASDKKEEALTLMRQAADMQERLGGGISVFKPLREQLADMLLSEGKNKEAVEEYSAVLKNFPNRFNALYGAGTAAFAMGNENEGRQYYTSLLKMTQGDERPELVTVRKRMTEQSAKN
jgi:tetratricopeptide (TPR) repeat protein